MLDAIAYWFHEAVGFFYIVNPFMMIFATCMWMVLKSRMDKELKRMYMRCYGLEKQVDFLVNNRNLSDADRHYFNYMTKTYKDLEEKIND